jgi:hypothetical protein
MPNCVAPVCGNNLYSHALHGHSRERVGVDVLNDSVGPGG